MLKFVLFVNYIQQQPSAPLLRGFPANNKAAGFVLK
jgi:hypothetical protein